jgi:outer membrane protein OmpA-like peptidoglycan-associated protein
LKLTNQEFKSMQQNLPAIAALITLTLAVSAQAEPNDNQGRQEHDLVGDAPFQLGGFVGTIFPASNHTLFDPSRSWEKLENVSPELGLRAGYYPLAFLGVEGEGAAMPTATASGRSVQLYALRAHLVAQVPTQTLTPFAVLGMGWMFETSRALGSDGDSSFQFGAGAKLGLGPGSLVRADIRDTVILTRGGSTATHHPEFLLGLSFGLGKPEAPVAPPAAADSDQDGLVDTSDACPQQAAATVDGCPVLDSDSDGVPDPIDRCPNQPSKELGGCPNLDPDKDGFAESNDECPDVAGIAPNGCPNLDPDQDGIATAEDRCPGEPESKNGFEDADGCPDELPEQIKRFTGVIAGIEFDFGKSTIRKTSFAQLDAALEVLKNYPSLRMKVTGHTDSIGSHDTNVVRSEQRAQAVKDYFVSHGLDASRIETRGAGPDEPLADNATPAGQQKNRRIEFTLIQ